MNKQIHLPSYKAKLTMKTHFKLKSQALDFFYILIKFLARKHISLNNNLVLEIEANLLLIICLWAKGIKMFSFIFYYNIHNAAEIFL